LDHFQNRITDKAIIIVTALILFFSCPTSSIGQEYIYLDQEGDDKKTLQVSISHFRDSLRLTLKSSNKYSRHSYAPPGFTQKWRMVDNDADHNFLAERKDNEISISGKYSGNRISKIVQIDDKPWINKLDHALSVWVKTDQEHTTFWTLKLGSGLDPIEFEAQKTDIEKVSTPAGVFNTIKVKINLEGFLVSNLWSAYLWYRKEDGLFIKYKGDSGPGTSLRIIELQEIL